MTPREQNKMWKKRIRLFRQEQRRFNKLNGTNNPKGLYCLICGRSLKNSTHHLFCNKHWRERQRRDSEEF